MASLLTYSRCCSIFSLSGMIFLLLIGILFDAQPVYMLGPDDKDEAAVQCYLGALMYFITMCVSAGYLYLHRQRAEAVDYSSFSPEEKAKINMKGAGRGASYGSDL